MTEAKIYDENGNVCLQTAQVTCKSVEHSIFNQKNILLIQPVKVLLQFINYLYAHIFIIPLSPPVFL